MLGNRTNLAEYEIYFRDKDLSEMEQEDIAREKEKQRKIAEHDKLMQRSRKMIHSKHLY